MDIGVYGLGRFGSFWARLLADRHSVRAYSRSRERRPPEGVERVTENEILELPVLFMCTSISSFAEVMQRIGGRLSPGTTLMDTCSVKVYPVRVMKKHVPRQIEVLATHPMFGPDSAQEGVSGCPIVLCPVNITEQRVDFWTNFFRTLGLNVLRMNAHDHDFEAANTQGITHYVGRVLADLGLKDSRISTLGYKKLLEIMAQTCNDPWQLFLDLQRYNPYTRKMRDRLNQSLSRIMAELESSIDTPIVEGYDNGESGRKNG